MDALSQLVRAVRWNSAVFFQAKFSAPWCFASPRAESVARALQDRPERLVIFHFVSEGHCRVEIDGLPTTELRAGDIVVFPQGDAHQMSSGPPVAPVPIADLPRLLRRKPHELEFGGGGPTTRFICGFLAGDPRLCRPILEGLPRVLVMNLRDDPPAPWLESSIHYAVTEAASPRPGGEGMLAMLSEVLFVETLRRYMATLAPEESGWLAGLRDRHVGKALALLHETPAHPWTVDTLAREAGTSRSVLAQRFTHFVGQSPMQYLARWRMALAANLLRSSSFGLARIAEEVGYETDTAFSRAFRREFGVPPATWRRGGSA